MTKKVNGRKSSSAGTPATGEGRVAQRNRTRRAIVDAATQLIATGATPSMAEVAEAAQVSRRTVYMYFPTLEQLLIDATLGALSQKSVDTAIAESSSRDAVERALELSRTTNRDSADTLHLGRALVRLTVEGESPSAGGPRRGYRRVQWIERALAPAREKLSPREFERLVSALCVLIGWDPIIALTDIRCLDQEQIDDVLTFAVGAVVEKALHDAEQRRRRSHRAVAD